MFTRLVLALLLSCIYVLAASGTYVLCIRVRRISCDSEYGFWDKIEYVLGNIPIRLCDSTLVANQPTAVSSNNHYTNATSAVFRSGTEGDYKFSFIYPPPTAGYHVATECTPTYLGDEAPMLFSSGRTCILTASSVQLYYWPTPYSTPATSPAITSAPSIRTMIGPDGYTFTSPSVYVVYYGLKAENEVAKYNSGPTYDTLTVAYGPTELSTLYGCSQTEMSTKMLNYQDFNLPPRWSVLSEHQGCDTCGQVYQFPGPPHPVNEVVTNYANMTYAYNAMVDGVASWRLRPQFALPTALENRNPAWKGCKGWTWGVFDPPRTLVAASTMVAPTIVPTNTPAVDPAKPAALPAQSTTFPAQTPAPAVPDKEKPTSDPKQDTPGDPALGPSQVLSSGNSKDPPSNPKPALVPTSSQNTPASPTKVPVSGPSQDSPAGPAKGQASDASQGKSEVSGKGSASDPSPNIAPTPAKVSTTDPSQGSTGSPAKDPASGKQSNAPANSPQDPAANQSQDTGADPTGVAPAIAQVAVAEHTIAAHPDGGVAVDGNPLQAGSSGSPTTTNGVQIAQNAGGVVIGGNAIEIPSAAPTGAFASVNGQGVEKAYGGGVIIAGSTLPSGAKASIGHVQVSIGNANVIVLPTTLPYIPVSPAGAQSAAVPAANNPPAQTNSGGQASPSGQTSGNEAQVQGSPALGIIAAGQTWTPLNQGTVIANGATISSGGPALTIGGTVVSVGASGLIAGTSNIAIPAMNAQPSTAKALPAVFTAAGQTWTQINQNAVIANGATLSIGGAPLTTDGTILSLATAGLVAGTSTIAIPAPSAHPISSQPEPAVFTAAGQAFTPLGNNQLLVNGATIIQNAPATTISGIAISLGTSVLVVGTSTLPLSNTIALSPPTPLTAAGHTFTPVGANAGTTTTPTNTTITPMNHTPSISNTSTTPPPPNPPPPSPSSGLGAVIMSGFGSAPSSTPPPVPSSSKSAAPKVVLGGARQVIAIFTSSTLLIGVRWVIEL